MRSGRRAIVLGIGTACWAISFAVPGMAAAVTVPTPAPFPTFTTTPSSLPGSTVPETTTTATTFTVPSSTAPPTTAASTTTSSTVRQTVPYTVPAPTFVTTPPPPTTPAPTTTTTSLAPINGQFQTPPSTLPFVTKAQSGHVNPALAKISLVGLALALVIMAVQFFLTRPGRDGPTL